MATSAFDFAGTDSGARPMGTSGGTGCRSADYARNKMQMSMFVVPGADIFKQVCFDRMQFWKLEVSNSIWVQFAILG